MQRLALIATIVVLATASARAELVPCAPVGTSTTTTTIASTTTTLPTPLSGTKLLLKDDPTNPAKRKMNVVARDAAVADTGGAGTADDPVVNGGSVRVFSLAEPAFDATFDLPAVDWRYLKKKKPDLGYRLTARPPFKRIVVKRGKHLKISARGSDLPHSLAERPGDIAVVVRLGAKQHCLVFGDPASFKEGKRLLVKDAPAPGACPDGPPASGTTTTTTTFGATTTSSIGPICLPPGPGEPARVAFTSSTGALACGGATRIGSDSVWTDGSGPFTGQLLDASDGVIGNLGLGCLYLGGGAGVNVPPNPVVEAATSLLAVSEVCTDGTLGLAPDAGNGPKDCTLGPAPTASCVDVLPATTACTQDSDCSGSSPGACAPDASCFFGPPIPIVNGSLSTCMIVAISDGVGGTIDPAVGAASLVMPLEARIYTTGNASRPCPTCVADVCDPTWMAANPSTPSPNAGDACAAEASSGVTHDCLPAGFFVGRILLDLTPLTTGQASLTSTDGGFCPGQVPAVGPGLYGAFGSDVARRIVATGEPFGDVTSGPGSGVLATTFCIRATDNTLVDGVFDLPGPGATSIPAVFELQCLAP